MRLKQKSIRSKSNPFELVLATRIKCCKEIVGNGMAFTKRRRQQRWWCDFRRSEYLSGCILQKKCTTIKSENKILESISVRRYWSLGGAFKLCVYPLLLGTYYMFCTSSCIAYRVFLFMLLASFFLLLFGAQSDCNIHRVCNLANRRRYRRHRSSIRQKHKLTLAFNRRKENGKTLGKVNAAIGCVCV